MPYTELEPVKEFEELKRVVEKGWILEDDKRIISFRVKTFQAFNERVAELFGSTVATVILYQMGNAIGHAGMKYSKERIRWLEDVRSVLDEVLTVRGWGRCAELTSKPAGGKTVYVFRTTGCPFCHERTSNVPVCHMMRGVLAGWLEEYFNGKAVDSHELECAATGGTSCLIEVVFER